MYVAMDMGVGDTFSMVFFQVDGAGGHSIINEYHNSGEGLSHYVDWAFSLGYDLVEWFVPHDAIQRDKNRAQTGIERLGELGVRNITLLPRLSVNFGIEQVRRLLVNGRIWVDSENCAYIDSMFKNYTKEWDARLGQWKEKPLHNDWSNPADAVRYMAMAKVGASDFSGDVATTRKKRKRSRSNVVDGMAM